MMVLQGELNVIADFVEEQTRLKAKCEKLLTALSTMSKPATEIALSRRIALIAAKKHV